MQGYAAACAFRSQRRPLIFFVELEAPSSVVCPSTFYGIYVVRVRLEHLLWLYFLCWVPRAVRAVAVLVVGGAFCSLLLY